MNDLTDPSDILAEQERQQQAARQAAIRAENLREAYRWLMGDKRGRMLMWSWLEMGCVFHANRFEQAIPMAFQEGNRNVGLRLMNAVLDHCPEQWGVMVVEFRNQGVSAHE